MSPDKPLHGEFEQPDVVYLVGNRRSPAHVDRDCPQLARARTVVERDPELHPEGLTYCKVCTGTTDQAGKQEQDHSHLRALKQAAASGGDIQ